MEIKEETKVVRYIEYDGKRFYEDGKGYWLGSITDETGKPHRIRLHIYVWEKFNGAVPCGYDIHHKDHDPSNNDLDNLELIERSAHHRLHMAERDKEELRGFLSDFARPAAAEWHRSEDGRIWHEEQYKRTLADKWDEKETLTCKWCGKPFECSVLVKTRSLFCSNKCKTAYRYHAGLDNITRVCPICGKEFSVNKYSRTKTCSPECGVESAKLSKSRRRASNL